MALWSVLAAPLLIGSDLRRCGGGGGLAALACARPAAACRLPRARSAQPTRHPRGPGARPRIHIPLRPPTHTCAPALRPPQDPLGQMGLRLENASSAPQQRWAKVLADGRVAVALYNRNGGNSTLRRCVAAARAAGALPGTPPPPRPPPPAQLPPLGRDDERLQRDGQPGRVLQRRGPGHGPGGLLLRPHLRGLLL